MLVWDLYGGLKDVTRKEILGSWGDKRGKANVTATLGSIEQSFILKAVEGVGGWNCLWGNKGRDRNRMNCKVQSQIAAEHW